MKNHKILLTIVLVLSYVTLDTRALELPVNGVEINDEQRKPDVTGHTITLEYSYGIVAFSLEGGGIGLGYERSLLPWLSIRGQISFGVGVATEQNGSIPILSTSVGLFFYPMKTVSKGLVLRLEAELIYISTVGEGLYGGLESHYLLPMGTLGLGWRFLIGSGRVRFAIQPEFMYSLIFPGHISSGVSGSLESSSTGIWWSFFRPSLMIGISL